MAVLRPASERGQVLVIIVLSMVALIGIVGLAIDGGNVYVDQRKAQNAADSAALASALARIRGENFVVKAYASAEKNGYNNDHTTNSVFVFSPPIEGEHKEDIEYIQVIITSHVKTYFAGIIGRDTIDNRVTAVARTQSQEITELLKGYAVVSLAPLSDCNNRKGFWVHGEATLDITGGGIFVNSNNPNCALIEQGGGSIRIRDDHRITVVGGAQIQKPKLLTPYPPDTGALPLPYPPPFFLPKVGCNKDAKIIVDELTGEPTDTMTAGHWSGDFPPAGIEILNKGIYCVGDFIINGGDKLSGSNVTIVVDGTLHWSGNAKIGLSASKSGKFAGLLIYLPIKNGNKVVLNGNAESRIQGTILAPGANIHINGNDSNYGFHSQIIGYRIDVKGNSNIIIKYLDEQNYDAYNMPEIELTQ
ncbi:MAG: Tad domain-containing protein [Anaerolineae bacterium]|nr:Tad domain-containing protein [Anaerolineae bacterium]